VTQRMQTVQITLREAASVHFQPLPCLQSANLVNRLNPATVEVKHTYYFAKQQLIAPHDQKHGSKSSNVWPVFFAVRWKWE